MLRLDQLIPQLDNDGFEQYQAVYLWHASFAFPDTWYSYMRTFRDFMGKVRISASNYYDFAPQGDMAVDNISITNGTCERNLGSYCNRYRISFKSLHLTAQRGRHTMSQGYDSEQNLLFPFSTVSPIKVFIIKIIKIDLCYT